MARSYRSQKESVTAARRIKRQPDGSPLLPRIVEQAPVPGDVNPLPRKTLQRLLPLHRLEYLYGLSRIELRARKLPEIGQPFGCYSPAERIIVLYSLPPVIHFRTLGYELHRYLKRFRAIIEKNSDGFSISWREPRHMAQWFYAYVFTPELGHHFVEQYKSKNSRIRSRNDEEEVADLHALRISDAIFSALRSARS